MEEIIKVEKLTKTYGSRKAVSNMNLSVNRGTAFALLGENGAGKSTAIECILGTKRADSGNVSVLGYDPAADRKTLFEKVGVQFQENNYQEKIIVTELCEVTASLYRKTAEPEYLLEKFGILDKLKSPVEELSGGQKQRLSVVLALLPEPEVVFLDELTTGLDTKARRAVWKTLSELKEKGLTILMTSHFMEEVEALCDEICILKQGETVFYGAVDDAIRNSPCNKLEDAYLWYTDMEGTADENF
ncbi:ABC transporter ATP-binding protein [Ruminococcus sp. OA3]|uniref:ABC transporter ATP-binding protein n=1 Tax=Ruminococcus sp. OA3 TaxID=2914164 RepID=UPI001F063125|nr:ABC transporter ATP-binding protein [Ruminococcus sp. OA3]MCH1982621.1 ABC transporter ATP-binding protein [Ruminococcus sp. OA3]